MCSIQKNSSGKQPGEETSKHSSCSFSFLHHKKPSTVAPPSSAPPSYDYGPAPRGNPGAIQSYDAQKDFQSVLKLWHFVLPMYAIPEAKLKDLLGKENGVHFVVKTIEKDHKTPAVGFVAAYKDPHRPTNYVTALIVHPAYQRRGLGTKLLDHAVEHLRTTTGKLRVTIGSSSPRFWPGIPLDIPAHGYDFFITKGFVPDKGPCARDYVIDLSNYCTPHLVAERAYKAGVVYHTLTPETADECLKLQHQLFGKDPVWTGAYEKLIKENNHGQIMVAFDEKTNIQLGWTLMTDPEIGGLIDDLALPTLVGDKTGLIACVGVHPDARKRGVGLGLVAAAAEDMKKRSLSHAFIDWVTLVGWYEKADAKVWREYRTLSSNSYISRRQEAIDGEN
ncbi:beta-glucosidase [Ascosphaera apis ARSEF 7405]|uniref:Beta-glucosidase n=1 Tax=Ascosphaera apis ARSEF 7405 TaxID=392613 RepID=A0A162I8L0_9EURO|nr:beta-glucosidase [Ascosphaera apis ARSEF 7405]